MNNFFWFQFSKIQYWKNLTLHCLLSVCGAVYYKAKACFQAILLCTQVTRSDLEIILTVASLYPVDVWTSAPHHSHHCLRLGWGHIKHWHKNNPLIWSTIFQNWRFFYQKSAIWVALEVEHSYFSGQNYAFKNNFEASWYIYAFKIHQLS